MFPLNELAAPNRIAGERQVRRMLQEDRLLKLFVAADADPALVKRLEEEARLKNVPVERAESMIKLGRACAISRGASAAGLFG